MDRTGRTRDQNVPIHINVWLRVLREHSIVWVVKKEAKSICIRPIVHAHELKLRRPLKLHIVLTNLNGFCCLFIT